MPRPPIPSNAHATPYRVCYADTDRMGRVYYANYLVFAERARTDLLRAAGHPYRALEDRGVLLPVRRCEVRYYGYAEYEELLSLLSWIRKLRHATVVFETAICRDGERAPLAVATVELACITPQGKPQAFPEDVLHILEPYVAEPPAHA